MLLVEGRRVQALMDFFCFSTCSFFSHFIAFGLRPSSSGFDGFFFCFLTCSFFSYFIGFCYRPSGWGFDGFFFCFSICRLFFHFFAFDLSCRVQAFMNFFCFLTCSFFFRFIAFSLRTSGSDFDGFSFFFNLQLLLPFYCVWFKAVGFRLWRIFFCFSTGSSFFDFIAFGLRPSGSGFDGFSFFFDLQLLYPLHWLWLKIVGFKRWWIFFVFRLAASLPILLALVWGRRVLSLMDFFVFRLATSFSILLVLVKGRRVQALMDFFLFFDLQLRFSFFCLWSKPAGFRLSWIFLVFWLAASFPILLPLV